MSENFYTILTATGKAKLANSAVLGSKVNFKTLKVGDGNGAYYEPTESQTSLVREVWSGNVSSISVDENNPNWIVAETLIPATIGGFFIREAGIFDEDGDLIAISKLSETYKPVVSEGSIKDLCIKIVLEVSNVSSVTLKIDPTVIVATRKDIDVLQAKMDASNAQTAEEIKELDSKLSEQISELANEISNKTVVTPAIGYGMNNVIKNVGETSVSPKFTIQGKTVVNLLGKDGNCEDISKWAGWQSNLSLDTTTKMFGTSSIKVTCSTMATNNVSVLYKNAWFDTNIKPNSYYCISAYVKNNNVSSINFFIGVNSQGVTILRGTQSSDTSKFVRILAIVKTDSVIHADIDIGGNCTAIGQSYWVDGFMVEEITSDQYNDPNFVPSPYVDSYACLTNPYIEVKHDNLVRNGNGEEGISWWSNTAIGETFSIINGVFSYTATGAYNGVWQNINVKPNTNYYFKGNQSGYVVLQVVDNNYGWLCDNGHSFNTGNLTQVKVIIRNNGTVGTGTADSIMLIEGTSAPTLYNTCRIERCVVEGKFADGDFLLLENGEVNGQINWKHKTLFGKDYDWQFSADYTGFKQLLVPSNIMMMGDCGLQGTRIMTKYDGKKLVPYITQVTDGVYDPNGVLSSYFYFTASDSDTGWAESINPNNDEVKAFMNGWKAFFGMPNNRYVIWMSVVDGSIPSIVPSTTTSANYTANSTTLVVSDASKFSVGDMIAIVGNNCGFAVIGSISGNTLTLSSACGLAVNSGATVYRTDNGSNDTRILNYCKANVAPNYEGYQLHYKLQNPEPITDANTNIRGDIPLFDVGDNYLYLDSGIVLDEVAIVTPNGPNTHAWINANDKYGINQNNSPRSSQLKNKTERIYNVYKNGVNDSNTWVYSDVNLINNAYGNQYIWVTPTTLVDLNATYTADYKILSTIAPQIGSFICNYKQDIVTTINNLEESINNKQAQNSILDNLIDLSIYENLYGWHVILPWVVTTGGAFFDININLVPKRVIPNTKFKSLRFMCGDIDITSKVIYEPTVSNIKPNYAHFQFHVTDTATISSIRTNGVWCIFDIDFDCRNKL